MYSVEMKKKRMKVQKEIICFYLCRQEWYDKGQCIVVATNLRKKGKIYRTTNKIIELEKKSE